MPSGIIISLLSFSNQMLEMLNSLAVEMRLVSVTTIALVQTSYTNMCYSSFLAALCIQALLAEVMKS